jgi:hypothetical protein
MSNQGDVPLENIAAIYLDEENGKKIIFTKDQLINQLIRVCPKIAESFDKTYMDEFKQLSTELSSILPKQYLGFKAVVEQKDDLRISCAGLLRNAANTITASVDSLRNGFRLQSSILIRTVIEICATVVHILVDEKAYSDFKSDKLKSTYSISVADRQIPLFGKAWGLLSKFNIHINTNHADWYPMNEYTDKSEVPSSVVLGILGYAMLILDIVTELTFVEEIGEIRYWKVLEPGKIQFVPPTNEMINWAKDMLKDIVK